MKRQIIEIDEEKCNGCGACADACHEGAIEIIDGKAKLTRDDYCDGLGDCLPSCPEDAISFVEREAAAYDEAAVKENMARKAAGNNGAGVSAAAGNGSAASAGAGATVGNGAATAAAAAHSSSFNSSPCGCPGAQAKKIEHSQNSTAAGTTLIEQECCLSQWPCQIKLVPINAPYFDGAKLLIAADCTAFAYASFHERFMKGHITLVGCPKLDAVDYSEKLTEIIRDNNIQSVTIARMEVPCCGGLENATKIALQNSGKFIPWNVVTISTDGKILD